MKPTQCAVCASDLTHPVKGRPRRFCSAKCRNEQRRRDWNAAREIGPRLCETCGDKLPVSVRRDARYCSKRCARSARSAREGRKPVASAEARFWSRLDRSGDCWLWTGARLANGYGSLRVNNRAVVTHRYAWELLRGPIPDGLQIDHLCRVRACCNPDHLEPVTQAENLRRAREAA